jgi:hypothetical protein
MLKVKSRCACADKCARKKAGGVPKAYIESGLLGRRAAGGFEGEGGSWSGADCDGVLMLG